MPRAAVADRMLSDADVAAIVDALAPRLAALVVQQSRRRPHALSRDDRDRLGRLLPAIVGAHGSEPFTVAELVDEYAAVRLVVDRLGLADLQQVGRLLSRAVDVPIAGRVVERVGTERERGLWHVVGIVDDGSPIVAPPAAPRRV
jgi:hypothetical protein